MCDDGSQKTSVGKGSRKGAWETDCGKSHREAGGREKDDPSLCVKSEITPVPSMCELLCGTIIEALSNYRSTLPVGGTNGDVLNGTEKTWEMENDIETTAHRRWVRTCVWNLTGLVAYNNNKNSNKNDNKSIFQRTRSL